MQSWPCQAWLDRASGGFEYHHRDDAAGGLLLVLRELGPVQLLLAPDAVVLGTLGHPGPDGNRLGSYLDRGVRVRLHVVEPALARSFVMVTDSGLE